MNNQSVVDYLESPEYEHLNRPQPVRGVLIEVTQDLPRHGQSRELEELCKQHRLLCTGKGYSWSPGDPVARFP